MACRYKGQFLFDLEGYKKFNKAFNEAHSGWIICTVLYCVLAFWMVHQFTIDSMVRYFLTLSLAFLILYFLSNPRKGNIHYKRMLQANNGQAVLQDCFFAEDGIHIINHPSENLLNLAYDQLCYGVHSDNLLILVMKHRTCLVIDTVTLTGGSSEDLFAFLKEHCPKVKENITVKLIWENGQTAPSP